jgi:hypothetical protein
MGTGLWSTVWKLIMRVMASWSLSGTNEKDAYEIDRASYFTGIKRRERETNRYSPRTVDV